MMNVVRNCVLFAKRMPILKRNYIIFDKSKESTRMQIIIWMIWNDLKGTFYLIKIK